MRFGPRRLFATGWTVDFSAVTPGALSAPSLLALGSGGLVLTRASAATVQSSASAVDSTPTVDVPRVQYDGSIRGLLFEETRTNLMIQSRSAGSGAWTQSGTVTAGAANGPDGATNTAARVQSTTAQDGAYQNTTPMNAYHCVSQWARATTGTSSYQIRGGGGTNFCAGVASIATTWQRVSARVKESYVSSYLVSNEGKDRSADGGLVAGARDCVVDLAQKEIGRFPTSAIITTSAAATRAGERLRHDTPASLLVTGRLGLALKFYPLGASTEYLANMRLWTIDASNYAEINFSTRAVTAVVGGVARSLGALPTWNALDLLEIWIAAGDGATLTAAKARVNGTITDLGTAAAQAAIVPGANPLEFLCAGTASQFSAVVSKVSTVQPAWV